MCRLPLTGQKSQLEAGIRRKQKERFLVHVVMGEEQFLKLSLRRNPGKPIGEGMGDAGEKGGE